MTPSGLKALIVGATGLVGSNILDLVLADSRFREVESFARRSTGRSFPKLRETVVDFDRMAEWTDRLRGDVLFSALGTTLRKAGGQEAQYRVDYTYQYQAAEAARRNGVGMYVLVSSVSASPGSRLFYLRMKGELERDVLRLGFTQTRILRPGPLAGEREEPRPLESALNRVLSAVAPLLPAASRPVPARTVALACIEAALDTVPGARILEPKEILDFRERPG